MKTKNFKLSLLSVLGFAFLASVYSVQGATINIGSGVGTLTGSFDLGQVQGFLTGSNNLNDYNASLIGTTPVPASEAALADYFNTTLAPDPAAVAYSKYDLQAGESDSNYTFSINSLYFALKLGNEFAFFKNNTGGAISLTYLQASGKAGAGAGLSNYTQFNPNPVPLPAAAYLFGSALLGMAGIGYSRNKKQV